MLAGASEAEVHPLTVAGFARARALSTSHDPAAASMPFDSNRSGFVVGEGAVVLCLEEREAALRRGAEPLAELLGFGMSCDASHITAPPEDGDGAFRAMRACLADARTGPDDVSVVVAHATSTPIGDKAEAAALSRLLGGREGRAAPAQVASIKGSVGHLLGAAGAVNVAAAVEALQSGRAPANVGTGARDTVRFEGGGARLSDGGPIEAGGRRPVVLCNAFGFGGTNAALCVAQHQ